MNELIRLARNGDSQAREELLVAVRPRLREWAEDALNARFSGRVDASDLTQITLLDLHQKLEQFVGNSEGEFVDWLRRVLQRNILDAVRRASAQKRSVEREQRIDSAPDEMAIPRNELAADISTPSMRAMNNEYADRLQRALDRLTPEQQRVVRLVHLEGRSLSNAAEQLNRSTAAAAKLLQRGIKNLRTALADDEDKGET
jgi:RNA polymerase sigma-70 factor (ECF subfamily)